MPTYVYVHRGWMPGSQRRCGSHVTAIAIFSSVKSSNSLMVYYGLSSGLFFHNSDLFQIVRTFFLGWKLPARKLPFLSSICRVLRAFGAGCGSNWQPPHSLLPGGSLGTGLSQELDPESLGVLAARPFRNPSNEVLIYLIYRYSYHKS